MRRIAFVFTIFAVLMPGSAISQGNLKSTHGDWELRYDTPPRAQREQCVVMQFVTDDGAGERLLDFQAPD